MLDYRAKTQLIVWSLLVFKKVIVQKQQPKHNITKNLPKDSLKATFKSWWYIWEASTLMHSVTDARQSLCQIWHLLYIAVHQMHGENGVNKYCFDSLVTLDKKKLCLFQTKNILSVLEIFTSYSTLFLSFVTFKNQLWSQKNKNQKPQQSLLKKYWRGKLFQAVRSGNWSLAGQK